MRGHSFVAVAAATAAPAERDRTNAGHGEVSFRSTLLVAAELAGALTIAAGAIAVVTGLTFPSAARRWLAYPFAGIAARPGEAAAIFLHNVRALAAVFGVLLIAQSPDWAGSTGDGSVHRAIRLSGQALLAAGVAANVIVVGVSLGAYGLRMFRAVLPHGPVELAAYALGIALCLQGRGKPLPTGHALVIAALSVSLLALAALLETFVNL